MNVTYSRLSLPLIVVVLGIVLVFGLGFRGAHAATTNTMTIEQQLALIQKLLDQIQLLQKQLATMQSSGDVGGQKNTCLELKNNMGYRSTGNEVSALQDFLQSKGFLNSAPTGFYGVMTTDAVKNFQAQYGVNATGYVGGETRELIKKNTCAATPTVPVTPAVKTPAISSMEGDQDGSLYKITVYGSNLDTVKAIYISGTMLRESQGTVTSRRSDKLTATFGSKVLGSAYRGLVAVKLLNQNGQFTSSSIYVTYSVIDNGVPQITSAEFQPEIVNGLNPHVRVRGEHLGDVEKLEYQANCCKPTEGTLTSGSLGKDTSAIFWLDKYLGNVGAQDLKVRVVDVDGNTSEWIEVKIENNQTAEPSISSESFINENSGIANGVAHTFNFTVKNWRPGLVLDIIPSISCNDQYISPLFRRCENYVFDFMQKAANSYYGVKADPYVKGGAMYRMDGTGTPTGESVSIRGYMNPTYTPSYENEQLPVPDSIEYEFILRDIVNGGVEVWSKKYTYQFKG